MFKKGYNMVVTSWENDGDAYNTTVCTFQTLTEVKFYLEWLQMFKSWDCDFKLSCMAEKGEVIRAVKHTLELREKYGLPQYESYGSDTWLISEEWLIDTAYEFFGPPAEDCYDFRVFESAEVYYVEEDMKPLELE